MSVHTRNKHFQANILDNNARIHSKSYKNGSVSADLWPIVQSRQVDPSPWVKRKGRELKKENCKINNSILLLAETSSPAKRLASNRAVRRLIRLHSSPGRSLSASTQGENSSSAALPDTEVASATQLNTHQRFFSLWYIWDKKTNHLSFICPILHTETLDANAVALMFAFNCPSGHLALKLKQLKSCISSTNLFPCLTSASSDFSLKARMRPKIGGSTSAFAFQVSPPPVIAGYL